MKGLRLKKKKEGKEKKKKSGVGQGMREAPKLGAAAS